VEYKKLVRLVLVLEACLFTTIDREVLNHFIGMYVHGLPALIASLFNAIQLHRRRVVAADLGT